MSWLIQAVATDECGQGREEDLYGGGMEAHTVRISGSEVSFSSRYMPFFPF